MAQQTRSAGPLRPEIHYLDSGWVRFRVAWHPDWVDTVKAIPSHKRLWVPEEKVWVVHADYADALIATTWRIFPPGEYGQEKQEPKAKHAGKLDPWKALHLRKSAPPALIDAAYRCMAKLAHPDHGGTNDQMRELNAAYAFLSAHVAA